MGPFAGEYSQQIEAKQPFMHVLVPHDRLDPASLRLLRANQDRLVTPFDIHNTLLGVVMHCTTCELQIVKTTPRSRGLYCP